MNMTSVSQVSEHLLGFCCGTNNPSMWDESSERTYTWKSLSFVFSADDAKSHLPCIFSAMLRRESAMRWLRYCSLAVVIFDIYEMWLKLVSNPNYSMWQTWTVWMMSITSLKVILSPGTSKAASDKRRISVETFMFWVVRWWKGLRGVFWRSHRIRRYELRRAVRWVALGTYLATCSASDDCGMLSSSVEPGGLSDLG